MSPIRRFFKNSKDLLTKPQSSIFSAAVVIGLTYGISMLLGIWRERVLVSNFFSCCKQQIDVYIAASRFPEMIFQLVVIGSLSAAFIPVFSHYLAESEEEAYKIASTLINFLFLIFLSLSIVVFIFAVPFSRLITGNFNSGQILLMASMTRWMLLVQIFFLISNFLAAISQSKQRFLVPSLSPIVYNLGIILCIQFLSAKLGIWSAVAGMVLGSFFHLFIQIPLALKLGFRPKLVLKLNHPGVKKVLKLMLPRSMALAADQVQSTMAVFFATSLVSGSLTVFYLAQRLSDLPVRLLGTSIGQAALPVLSSQVARGKMVEFKKTIQESLGQIFYLGLPATGFFLVLRVQMVRFAYGVKTFPWEATIDTGKVLAAITFSIFSQCVTQLLVRGFYALHDTYTPFLISLGSVILNIILSWFFVFILKIGIFGLALAYSASNLFSFLLLLFFFNKKEKLIEKGVIVSWIKMLFSSVISVFVCWVSMKFLDNYFFDTRKTVSLLAVTAISGGLGLTVYLLLSKIFHLKEYRMFFSLIRRIGSWRKNLFSVEEIIEPH